ncbi:protein DD3-3-like [Dendronephthya gigantea]|uniref:protein DD3-3-like n=1 Tax=Dendronephthya gigantea TaxID=151771 RepID=UPI00106B4FC7|nr:protein DD3-3-like [Dendronephthya gigantea]
MNCLLITTLVLAAGLLLMKSSTDADMFLHNPRGSNNRLNGAGANRANNNRMFDSQNNAKGGYNVGDKTASASTSEETQFNMHYFQSGKHDPSSQGLAGKSLLTIEWTNQHGCNDRDLNCNIVLQYRCQDDKNNQKLGHHSMRNGKTTTSPQYSKYTFTTRYYKNYYLNVDSAGFARGLHESWEWYDKCYKRDRNKGLFTADQTLKGDKSIYTRQNANGARSGYECPEERDYYPYWHPTDWTDIVVLAYNESMCKYYQEESFNTKTKGECLQYYPSKADGFQHYSAYNNKRDCEKNQGFWVAYSNYLEEYPKYQTKQGCESARSKDLPLIWAIPYRSEDIDNFKMTGDNVDSLKRCLVGLNKPDCKPAPYSRSNHLGNGENVIPLRYTWTIPHFPSKRAQRCVLRIRYNISTGDYPPFKTFSEQNNDPDNGVYSPVQNNPKVKVGQVQLPLQLAINTAQFGRTFQDRSHLFKLVPRPDSVSDHDVIRNLNVRGKRGNIVQAYPAVEYDFIPKRMTIASSSLLHIQWTGSNTNPNGNAGQGKAGSDRTNMVEMKDPSLSYPITSEKPLSMFTNAEIVWSSDPATKTKEDLILSMASSGYYNSMTLCKASPDKAALDVQLNNAPASYRGMLLRFSPGEYYYMCTRNNAFTNRSQKGRLLVHDVPGKNLAKK